MAKQLEFKRIKGWGGKRRGAGRPNKTGLVSHGKRPSVNFKNPPHLTMRLKKDAVNLRTRALLKEFKKCGKRAKEFGLYVNHFSLLSNHIHMIVEAKDNQSLSRGMKSLCGRFGRIVGNGKSVFAGRFHLHQLKNPRAMRNALEYVLLNKSKHEDLLGYVDNFSSGAFFDGWKWLAGNNPLLRDLIGRRIELPDELSVSRSWLGRCGWQKALGPPSTL